MARCNQPLVQCKCSLIETGIRLRGNFLQMFTIAKIMIAKNFNGCTFSIANMFPVTFSAIIANILQRRKLQFTLLFGPNTVKLLFSLYTEWCKRQTYHTATRRSLRVAFESASLAIAALGQNKFVTGSERGAETEQYGQFVTSHPTQRVYKNNGTRGEDNSPTHIYQPLYRRWPVTFSQFC